MYNTTKVKTFQPIIPAGNGPICMTALDAIAEILSDVNDAAKDGLNAREFEKVQNVIVDGLGIDGWIDGEYTVFEDYKIKVRTYQQGQLDEMKEFEGY